MVSLINFNRCRWVVDLSSTKEPDVVLNSYFNEKGLFDVKDKLEDSDITNFLPPVTRGDSEGYYVFPYFIIIRASCDSGSYDDSYYRLIMNGDYPTIVLQYWPATSRTSIKRSLKVTTTGALINVQPDEQYKKVPKNPTVPICYMDMCYPAFVVPLVFLHLPIFEVVVEAVDEFSKSRTRIHVSPFHSREGSGNGPEDIVLTGDSKSIPSADLFFPIERITDVEDPDGLTKEIVSNFADPDHFPLDKEDFIEPQYTYGTAPVIFFSGFYAPDLVIMADPDLQDIHLIRWGRNPLLGNTSDVNATIFDHALSCNLPPDYAYYKDAAYPIPYYTRGEGTIKKDWLGTYYRKRIQPMEYHRFPAPTAIYEAISMEDRILLVTNSGLVVLYGDTNGTMAADSALKATGDEKVRKCFKIVRTSRFAFQDSDLIVAVTYNYTEMRSYKNNQAPMTTAEEIDQEIFIGKLSTEGKPINWIQLGETEGMDYGVLEAKAQRAQSSDICAQVRESYFKLDSDIEIQHCIVIDATPVSGLTETIQVMVEMVIMHKPTMTAFESPKKNELKIIEEEAFLTFYIIAQYTPLKQFSKEFWNIISILPRRPCKETRKQSIQTLENYDTNTYFNHDKTADPKEVNVESFKKNCHYRFRHNMKDDLHLKRMTYTRQSNGQMFLYGNNLVHSTDKGVAFANLPGFPSEDDAKAVMKATQDFLSASDNDRQEKYHVALEMSKSHVIKVMAFSDGPYYAFLTSKRHLYLGSTGTLHLILLRPSAGYSMIRTVVTSSPGLHDGRPFSVIFDSINRLFEMVAIVNSDKKVVAIRKREIPWQLITENINFVKKLRDAVKRSNERKSGGSGDFENNVFFKGYKTFKTYCPYGDPSVSQNYTTTLSQLQHISIREPLQHKHLGTASTFKSLMAFQASAYSMIHICYLNPETQMFSHLSTDTLKSWTAKGRKQSQTGFFKYYVGDPHKFGIIVDPSSFKRLDHSGKGAAKIMPDRIVLDYNQLIKFEITFAVTAATSIDRTDYREQKLSDLQLTVDNGNETVVSVGTERQIKANNGIVSFSIFIEVNKYTANLPQNLPGMDPTIVPIAFHFIGAFQNCLPKYGGAYIGDSISTSIYAGCPASSEIQLNWNLTLRSMRFRDPEAWMGIGEDDCYGGEPVCFFVKLPLIFFFDIYDAGKEKYIPYTGKYTLRVTGGGYTKNSIIMYDEEEQEEYNIPGKSDISLIWSEWDKETNQKVKAKRDFEQLEAKEVVLVSGKSAIKWTCHALSPCSRVLPTWRLYTVYYFNIKISNRGVDKDTICLLERDFVIQLYGFIPSSEMQLIISMTICILILLLLYLMYLCCRNSRRVWRANKLKMYGWMQIVLDTVPTSKTYSDTSKELSDQIRRDEIILSLQGHLQIPTGLPPSKPREPTAKKRTSRTSRSSEQSGASSRSTSSESKDNMKIQSGKLPHVHARNAPATWTDMIYDQIITKRLNAIIERNDKMKDVILKKVEMTDMLRNADEFNNQEVAKEK
ncbi:unnamed protein product [Allacma fusca]|uniref:CATSPERG C-terminal domain-containing protein n=1 Tax=Allacma fusca TaxID=39272 RepID=A0A8J2M8T6_9HEXA|nr:unnamed protein product [Allacma fusca]